MMGFLALSLPLPAVVGLGFALATLTFPLTAWLVMG